MRAGDVPACPAHAPWEKLIDLNPGILGHALRIGSGRVGPAPVEADQ